MNDKDLIILLHIINSNGNINRLIREGLTYKNITNLTSFAIETGYLSYENERVLLTKEGLQFLENERGRITKRNKNEWIQKDIKSQTPLLDKSVLFLPNQNELTF